MARVKIIAPSADRKTLDVEIAKLRDLDTGGLRARWHTVFRQCPPSHLPRHLLFAIIAYRLQAQTLGDLDLEILRLLKKIEASQSDAHSIPLTDAFDQRRRNLSPGTILTREWNGRMHRVAVVNEGFAWEGSTYASLSKIAYAITGTKWNGPRFFGLRDKISPEVAQ